MGSNSADIQWAGKNRAFDIMNILSSSSKYNSFEEAKSMRPSLFNNPLYGSSEVLKTKLPTVPKFSEVYKIDTFSNSKLNSSLIPKGINTPETPNHLTLSNSTNLKHAGKSQQSGIGSSIKGGLISAGISLASEAILTGVANREQKKANKELKALQEKEQNRINLENSIQNNQNTNANNFLSILSRSNKEVPTAKNGTKLELQKFINRVEPLGDKNIIPKGNLHKNKNNIGDKGIPVINKNKEKVLEIELGELIFRHEATTKIESLVKEYNTSKDDGVLLHLGKCVAVELGLNTEDLTGTFTEILK